jgi:hypothetical protein
MSITDRWLCDLCVRSRRTRGGLAQPPRDARFTSRREITGPTRRPTTACRWRMM